MKKGEKSTNDQRQGPAELGCAHQCGLTSATSATYALFSISNELPVFPKPVIAVMKHCFHTQNSSGIHGCDSFSVEFVLPPSFLITLCFSNC